MTGVVVDGVAPQAVRVAQDTLGGALAVATTLPDPLGADLLDKAREAFVHAFQMTAGISALVALVAAGLAGALLRKARGRG